MTQKKTQEPLYPHFICPRCGVLYGNRLVNDCATYHEGNCGICGKMRIVTEPRDFGHLKEGWQNHRRTEA